MLNYFKKSKPRHQVYINPEEETLSYQQPRPDIEKEIIFENFILSVEDNHIEIHDLVSTYNNLITKARFFDCNDVYQVLVDVHQKIEHIALLFQQNKNVLNIDTKRVSKLRWNIIKTLSGSNLHTTSKHFWMNKNCSNLSDILKIVHDINVIIKELKQPLIDLDEMIKHMRYYYKTIIDDVNTYNNMIIHARLFDCDDIVRILSDIAQNLKRIQSLYLRAVQNNASKHLHDVIENSKMHLVHTMKNMEPTSISFWKNKHCSNYDDIEQGFLHLDVVMDQITS